MLKVEHIAGRVLDPSRFLEWYAWKWADGFEFPEDFESCAEICLREGGAEKTIVWLPGDEDGFLEVFAGVQSVKLEWPKWVDSFLDRVGWDMQCEAAVVIALADVTRKR